MKRILLLNGPNLNMLGRREPQIYGSQTLSDIENHLQAEAQKRGYELDYFQANGEEPIVNRYHQPRGVHSHQCCLTRCIVGGRYSFCGSASLQRPRPRTFSPSLLFK